MVSVSGHESVDGVQQHEDGARDHDGAQQEQGALLHSLTVFWDQIETALRAVNPQRVVEIGGESGGMTKMLTEWAEAAQGQVVSIEPSPTAETRELALRFAHLHLVEAASPAALAEIERAEVYVIDGDHNYWTVSRELDHVFGDAEAPAALAILHDVAWPCARRDQYYVPARLPEAAVHDHSFRRGARPDVSELVEGGFRGAGVFARAVTEGGERNGVLTAVDDLCRTRDDLRFLRIPCVFGLGFLFPRAAGWAAEVERELAPFAESPLLAALERNRIGLYLRVIALQDQLEGERLRASRVLADWHTRVDDLQAEALARETIHADTAP